MNIAKFTEEALLKITQHQDSSTSSSQVIDENPALSFDNQFVPQIIQISSGSETTEVQGLDTEKIIDVLKWNDTMEPGEEQFGQQIIIDHHQQPINLERVIFLTDSDNQTLLSCENTPTEDAQEEISIKEPQLEHPVYESTQAMLKFSAFEDFKEALHYYESQTITKFILRNQSKDFQSQVCLHEILNNDQITSDLPKIRWEFCAARDFLPIPYMGTPYISVGKQVYQCHQGKDYNTSKKEQYELKREILNQASRYQIKQRQKGVTKKTDCPVLFGVRKLFTFPAYPLHENSKRGRALIAEKIRKQLFKIKREPCTCSEDKTPADNNSILATGCLEYFTRFPSNNEHNHSAAKAATTLKLPRRLPLRVQDHNEEGAKVVQAKKSSRSKKTAEVNPYQYDKHIKLISALRTLGDLDQLRSAREKMATVYPLSEDLWMEWFSDELPLAVLQEQKQFLQQKFEQAVKDYSSVKIWHEYCQFVMNNIESPTDIEKARSIFERAITAVGLNVIEGASVWEGFREFEIAILDSYQQLQDSGDAIGMCAKVEAQIERIASLFKRQLSIPLLGMEDVMSAYEDWSSEGVPAEVHRSYQRASDKLQLCMQHESKLTSSEGDASLTAYLDYISYEMKDGDPARIQCLFERAIKQHCLHYDLWIKYLNYLDYKLKITDIALPVHERAVRNCPWIATLWIRYLHSLERGKKDYSKIKDVFNESLKGGFSGSEAYLQLWISHSDYHRRRIDDWTTEIEKVEDLHKCYEEAVTYMQQYFGLEGDEECVILRDLAFIEAKHLNNLEKGKDLWKTILKKHQRSTNMWLEYITYLKLFGDVTSVRRAFQRAIQISFDQPELILQEFIRYERLYGDLSGLDDAQQKVDSQMIKINEKRTKEASEKANKTEQKEKPRKDKRNKKNIDIEEKTNKQNKKKQKDNKLKRTTLPNAMDVDSPVKKRKEVEDTVETEDCNNITPSSIEALNTKGESTSNQSTTLEHNFLPPADVAMATKQPGGTTANVEKEENADEELKSDQVIVDGEAVRKVDNELSIFLSNLLFTVDEKHIKDKFQPCGEIDTIRIVKNRVGKSKGYAYLQFNSMKGVEESLLLDRQPMLGRPMFVSRCVDKRQNPTKFKFPTELDKHTLYVSNLPFEMSNDQLETYFATVGKLKQVRLVTNRSGKSKGYAYVEFETEADAKTAIVKFDQKPLHDRPINVALSNPPSRKNANAHEGKARALKPKEQPGVRSKARTQISMVPRALQKPATNTTKKEPIAEKMDTTTTEAENSAAPKAMSNEEFRKFLMS